VKRVDIILLSGQSLAVDATLAVASLSETVTVTGESPVVDTRNSALVNTAMRPRWRASHWEGATSKSWASMPGVTDTKYNFSPVVVVHGGSVRDNILQSGWD